MRSHATVLLAALLGCSSNTAAPSDPPALANPAPAGGRAGWGEAADTDTRRWIPGDLHMHVAGMDWDARRGLTVAEIERLGPSAGLEFIILTPHLPRHAWQSRSDRRAWQKRWQEMAAEARAARGLTLIPGAEYTAWGHGHFGVSGVDLGALDDSDLLAAATGAGGFVVVNHPFALPTRIPGIPISDHDLSFRPWTHDRGEVPALDGVEVWNLPLGLANLVSRPGGLTGEERAMAAADALVRKGRRRVALVGGSDNHRRQLVPTTWVLAEDAGEPAVLAALRAGATCVGGPEAGTLRARGDLDPPDRWARIGAAAGAAARVELRWSGRARLFVDGADAGEHDGGWVHADAGGLHTYRIQAGGSRCGFVYANLD